MKKKSVATVPSGWARSYHLQVRGRHISPGTELRIMGQRGRFQFLSHTQTAACEWVDVRDKDGRYRSFRIEAIRTVHTKKRMRSKKD